MNRKTSIISVTRGFVTLKKYRSNPELVYRCSIISSKTPDVSVAVEILGHRISTTILKEKGVRVSLTFNNPQWSGQCSSGIRLGTHFSGKEKKHITLHLCSIDLNATKWGWIPNPALYTFNSQELSDQSVTAKYETFKIKSNIL